uniref:DEAD/DEAH box helicase n=1 Tax=Ndongobacter massiliensis TaxID=1871025 RepID=UPI00092FEFD6|nr:DEAD/DEAH box helicase family protein [Ndongobacter massiliensis]
MRVSLFPFQQIALQNLRMNTAEALGSYQRTHTPQVISFTAPTGSGKTIIMSAFIESVYYGDEHYPEQPEAIFVWLSDSPELNEQSKLKIDLKADRISLGQTVTITDESFDREILEDGHIYFLNTQKLSKSANLTKHSDNRQFTIWETLRNTALKKSDHLYFIIDEAHRGMQGKKAGEATTTMQKFLKGSPADKLNSLPVVIGMSATTERFNALVEGTSSTVHKVVVTPDDVRSSGLLKDRIVISYSEESSVNKDMAVLQAAADNWKDKCDHWYQYCFEQHYAQVNPIFVVQVENGTAERISNTDLDVCLQKIETRTGFKFSKGEVVHAFGETKSALTIAGLEVPYEEPSRISDNKQVRVVFFKESLSTGWDCPRAETMMSFRHAKDATYIAQLLGRMVRTPMQMHIQVDDSLNDVHLYLPYFDKYTVDDVIDALQSAEGSSLPTDIYGESIEHKSFETLTIHPRRVPSHRTTSQLPGQMSFGDNQKDDALQTNVYTPASTSVNSTPETPDEMVALSSHGESELAETEGTDGAFILQAETSGGNADIARAHVDSSINEPAQNVASSEIKQQEEIDEILPVIDRDHVVKAINDSGLLTYDVRKIRINDYLKSLYSMTRLLVQSGMESEASDKIHREIVSQIHDFIMELKTAGTYKELVEKAKEFKLSTQVFDIFGKTMNVDVNLFERSFFTTDADIERQFRLAEAKLGNEGIANLYVNTFFDFDRIDDLKIDVILFAADDSCMAHLSTYAKERFHALNDQYRRYMPKLDERFRRQYDRIVSDGDIISKHNFRLPETITVANEKGGRKYYDHLFVNDDGYTTMRLNGWEEGVLAEEEKRDDFVCWIRNPSRASWALCIPYQLDGEMKPTYPDFIVIRKDPVMEGELIIDVLEPHNPDFNDNLAKAKGFAEYARQNPGVGRIELIRKGKDTTGKERFKRLDMAMNAVRDKVMQAMTTEELNRLFDTDGKFE